MKCPCCAAAKLIHDIHDMPYTYKNDTTSKPCSVGRLPPSLW